MRTNVEMSIKSTDTLEEQYKYRVRRQLVIDATTNADYLQGTTRGNLKGNSGTGDKVMEPNIPRAQTEWRMEKYLTFVPDTRNQLYISGDAIWDQYCAIHIRENDTTNSGESEREMRDANIELCR
ncbi:MAG: hypothetical protein EZS28_016972 [Streblomastix strix]|uniref:Uncharacterized protein n=1 Tax=Streblomastix strix TaxID=222440 RepID=A0A5J4VXX6_9EUKA|nr:MAG: hypothetical protein EZS28_016972 [Streblomastix strix]